MTLCNKFGNTTIRQRSLCTRPLVARYGGVAIPGFVAVWLVLALATRPADAQEAPIEVLIVDGENLYHDWQRTTPILRRILEHAGRFRVDVATAPAAPAPIEGFSPRFSDYRVVVSNYNGRSWSTATQTAFEEFVRGGGGFVSVHAANNAFPEWSAYNRMIGLGGWRERDERSGPKVFLSARGETVRDERPGPGGHHGPQHEFPIVVREPDHPILRGMPRTWLHTQDELYDSLRGPAVDMRILATAYSDPAREGTGNHEPMVMALEFGQGRVFHIALGHATYSMACVGFVTLLQRGTEWTATGQVTIPIPDNFPTTDHSQAWSVLEPDEAVVPGE